jgi:molybdenum cofactor cytidylyltransferase
MYDCVVAAAGASSRMGALKPLLPFAGTTMIGAVVGAALDSGCRVLVVVGYRGAEVAEAALRAAASRVPLHTGGDRILVVENPAWEEGMLGSIQAALGLVRGPAFFEMNADMPLVPASIYALLARERARRDGEGLPEAALFAASAGRAGHPVLIPSAWIAQILELPRGDRMKRFLDGRSAALVEAGTEAVLADIDTPAEYGAAGGSPIFR